MLNTTKPGWYHLAIGRERWIKRLNLSVTEARQLRDRLNELLPDR